MAGEPGALFAIETVPDALPPEAGEKVTVNGAVCPGVSVCGERVLILKPVPLALADVIVRLAVPEFVKVTFTVEEAPTATFPKFTLAGLRDTAA
jgi:hypothetical protein